MAATVLRKDIQGLRALAVLLVIAFHLPTGIDFTGGFVGVDIFFVISGFVVTKMILSSSGSPRTAGIAAGDFLRRRALRLVPALSVVVIVTVLLSVLLAPVAELGSDAQAGLFSQLFVSNGFYARNFDTYWDPAVLRSPFLHMWSLGVEFQTYLAFPIVFAAILVPSRRTPARVRGVFLATAILAVISLVVFVGLVVLPAFSVHGVSSPALAFYTPVTRLWEFAAGILPAMLSWRGGWPGRRPLPWISFVAWPLIVLGVLGCATTGTLGLAVIPAAIGTSLLLGNGDRAVDARRSLLEWKPLGWIGDRSYSIYLWHWPLLVFALWLAPGNRVVTLVAVLGAFGLAMASYRWVELRFRRSTATGWRRLRPTAIFVMSGALVSAMALGIAASPWYANAVPLTAAATPFADDGPTAADMDSALDGCDVRAETISCDNKADAGWVVVIGDSLGYRAFPAVQLAARQRGLNASMMWTSGCTIEVNSCPASFYRYLGSHPVAAILVTSNFDRAADRVNGVQIAAGQTPVCSVATVDCPAHRAAVVEFQAKAAPGLRQLDRYSDHILVALPFPQQSQDVGACLSPGLYQRVGATVDPLRCGRTSLAWQKARQGLFPAAITAAVAEDARATLWNPAHYLCDARWCPAVINDGDRIMSDAIHWSWAGSRFLYPEYASYLATITT